MVALVSTNLGLQCRSLRCTRLVGGDRCGFGRCGSVQSSEGRTLVEFFGTITNVGISGCWMR